MSDPKIYPLDDIDEAESVSASDARSKKKSGVVQQEESTKYDFFEESRITIKHFVEDSAIGMMYGQCIVYLSVISALQCIVQTYYEETSIASIYFSEVELAMAIIFLVDWSLLLFLAERKLSHLKSFYCVIDLCTCIPIFLTYHTTCPDYTEAARENFSPALLYYILCGLSRIRILRALRLRRRFLAIEDAVDRFVAEIALSMVLLILFNAAVMQYLEPRQQYGIHVWIYYSVVTLATIGYGDILPFTDIGRFATMVMICTAVVVVPQMVSDLNSKMSESSVYARAKYFPKTHKSIHILLCGDLSSTSLLEFFLELFHEDHDMQNLHAIIMQPEAPSHEVLTILRDINYSSTVSYLEGNALNEHDLTRAHANEAKAIFIMTNKFSVDPDQEDAKTILQEFSIMRYLRTHMDPNRKTFFCSQLIRPENKRHLAVTSSDSKDQHLVVCINEIKMGVVAKAINYPGANTLIMNLISSFADEDNSPNTTVVEGIETLDDDENNDWLGEYQRGCDWEIYTTPLPEKFEGAIFCLLSEWLYSELGVVLFALEVVDTSKDRAVAKLLLNPANFVIPVKDGKICVEAFVIAKNSNQSDLCAVIFGDIPDNVFDRDALYRVNVPPTSSPYGAAASGDLRHAALSAAGTGEEEKHADSRQHVFAESQQPSASVASVHLNTMREKQAWQMVLRQRQMDKSTKTQQEEEQKQEDRFLKNNFYTREAGLLLELADAYINTNLMDEMPYIDNHIIIIGKALSNLYDLILPLREKQLGSLKHIVIMYPYEFPIAVWQRINIFESIWIIRGTALEEADMYRAGIFKAKEVVVLASAANAAELGALVDTDAVFCYQCVRRMNETAHVVVEIVNQANVAYMDPEASSTSSEIGYKFSPQFASGALIVSSMLDTLACQSFYNPKIMAVLNKLIAAGDTENTNNSTSSTDSNHSTPSGSQLYQINIPEGLASRTYGAMYQLLSNKGVIPLGILRGVFANTKTGPKANKLPYVFTNPPKDTELFTCDKIFILSQKPMLLKHAMGKGNPGRNDDLKEMHVYESLRRRKKTPDDIMKKVTELHGDLAEFEHSYDNISARMQTLNLNVQLEFEKVLSLLNERKPQPSSGVITSADDSSSSDHRMSGRSGRSSGSNRGSGNGNNKTNNGNGNNNQGMAPLRSATDQAKSSQKWSKRVGSPSAAAASSTSNRPRSSSDNKTDSRSISTGRLAIHRPISASKGSSISTAGYDAVPSAANSVGNRPLSAANPRRPSMLLNDSEPTKRRSSHSVINISPNHPRLGWHPNGSPMTAGGGGDISRPESGHSGGGGGERSSRPGSGGSRSSATPVSTRSKRNIERFDAQAAEERLTLMRRLHR